MLLKMFDQQLVMQRFICPQTIQNPVSEIVIAVRICIRQDLSERYMQYLPGIVLMK